MSKKRMTDADIWKKKWFRRLPVRLKAGWFYLKDNCDHVGIWEIDEELMSFMIGEDVTIKELKEAFKHRINLFDNDTKVFLSEFCDFQYGELKPTNNAHRSYIAKLQSYGFWDEAKGTIRGVDTPKKIHSAPQKNISGDKEQVQVKEEDKDKAKEKEEAPQDKNQTSVEDFIQLDQVMNLFNQTLAGHGEIDRCIDLSGVDRRNFVDLVDQSPEFKKIETWKTLFEKVLERPKLLGTNDGWNCTAHLGWLVKYKNATDVINGGYKGVDKPKSAKGNPRAIVKLGTGEEVSPAEVPGKIIETIRSGVRRNEDAEKILGEQIWKAVISKTSWTWLCQSDEFDSKQILNQIKKELIFSHEGAA